MKLRMTRVICALLVVAGLAVQPGSPASAHHGQQWILQMPNQGNLFTNYDYRQGGWGDVDWPTGFIFRGNAHVNRVKDGVCNLTNHFWKFCIAGGIPNMYVKGVPPADSWEGFDTDRGRKRFDQFCDSMEWTSHMRMYAPQTTNGQGGGNDNFFSVEFGFMVVGTTHLDYQDKDGCGARQHGHTEVAENWFLGTLNGIPGWTVNPEIWGFANANGNHTIMRNLGGAMVPHTYDNNGLATEVVVP